MTRAQLLRLMNREVARVENRGVRQAHITLRKFTSRLLSQYRRTGMFHLEEMVEELENKLADLMYVQHLLGVKRGQILYKRKETLAFDIKDILEKQLDVKNVNRLQEQFSTDALRVLNGVTQKAERKLREKVNQLIAEGAPRTRAINELRDAFENEGFSATASQLEAIYRTQSQIAYNAGRWIADQDPAIQEILWGYEYITAGDDRVRPAHERLDGVKLPKDDPFWESFFPPNGWNCRCQAVPIFEKPKRIKRPSVDIQPDSGFNFNPGRVYDTEVKELKAVAPGTFDIPGIPKSIQRKMEAVNDPGTKTLLVPLAAKPDHIARIQAVYPTKTLKRVNINRLIKSS